MVVFGTIMRIDTHSDAPMREESTVKKLSSQIITLVVLVTLTVASDADAGWGWFGGGCSSSSAAGAALTAECPITGAAGALLRRLLGRLLRR